MRVRPDLLLIEPSLAVFEIVQEGIAYLELWDLLGEVRQELPFRGLEHSRPGHSLDASASVRFIGKFEAGCSQSG
jgi:hypothetical protein